MKILIIGAGKMGKYLAQTLVKEKHNITVIDKNESVIQVNKIGYFIILYFVLIGIITLIVSLDNFDFETTLTSVIACK